MKTARVTLCCLMLTNFISEAYGCRCLYFSGKEAFCRAAFVIRGIVKNSRTLASSWVEFDVEVKDNFKNKVNNMIKLRSSTNSCGVRLTTGSEYLITGEVRSDSPYGRFYYTRLCFGVQILWQHVSKYTQTALQTGTFTTC